jgi:hypothetical protein
VPTLTVNFCLENHKIAELGALYNFFAAKFRLSYLKIYGWLSIDSCHLLFIGKKIKQKYPDKNQSF